MLENLRDKIFSVQQELSASFKNLKTGDVSLTRSKSQLFRKKHFSCNFNAGADLLLYYQKQWEELHNMNEENAKMAEEVGLLTEAQHAYSQQQHSTMQQMNAQLGQVPRLQASVMALMNKIGELEGLFEEVESALVNLEDIIETQQLQEKQLDQRFQLALEKEKRLAGFESTKLRLAEIHVEKVSQFEEKQKRILKERQETFKEVFEEEMELYKAYGKLERPSGSVNIGSSLELEEIQLDEDEEDQDKLDAFLCDDHNISLSGELSSTCEDESDSSNQTPKS